MESAGNSKPRIVTGKVKTRTSDMPFEAFDTAYCRDVTGAILKGQTYPHLPFIDDVRTIVDIGANIGATSVYFWINYPLARILAIEPAPETFKVLSRNLANIRNVECLELGLFDRDCELPMFMSLHDPCTHSVAKSYLNSEHSVPVRMRNAADVMREKKIDAIDILKIDTEGCELPILRSLEAMLLRIRVIYLTYHDEADRIAIDAVLGESHILMTARAQRVHRGQLTYVNRGSFPSQTALEGWRIRSETIVEAPPPATPIPAEVSVEARTHAVRSHPQTRVPVRSQFEAAVVMPTLIRPSLISAVESVFAQDALGAMQLLIGVDKATGDRAILDEIVAMKPDNWELTLIDLGYSTSRRHGGIHRSGDGGALRTILSYAANSRYVAYLDDDNWWAKDHLSSLLKTIAGFDWAFSKRWFVDAETRKPIWVDEWESLGPGRGVYVPRFGGFCDPNTLMIDKTACESVLRWWSIPQYNNPRNMAADRNIFRHLSKNYKWNGSGRATCYYVMSPTDIQHPSRLTRIAEAINASA